MHYPWGSGGLEPNPDGEKKLKYDDPRAFGSSIEASTAAPAGGASYWPSGQTSGPQLGPFSGGAQRSQAAPSWHHDASTPMQPPGAQMADAYGGYDASRFAIPPELLEGAKSVEVRPSSLVSERLVETQQQVIAGVPRDMFHSSAAADREAVRAMMDRMAEGNVAVAGVRPIYITEKVVEVPHVITREHERYVARPEIIERLIEVPKPEVHERTVKLPPQVQIEEQIVEVPEVIIEERIVHVPKREIQERLIEVPKVRYVERIEYEDVVEYREVPVDRIVEVPEIEYRVREVEHLVPQTYVQEYFVDKYTEVPVMQVQEVERIEHVPVVVPPGFQTGYSQANPQATASYGPNVGALQSFAQPPAQAAAATAGLSASCPSAAPGSLMATQFHQQSPQLHSRFQSQPPLQHQPFSRVSSQPFPLQSQTQDAPTPPMPASAASVQSLQSFTQAPPLTHSQHAVPSASCAYGSYLQHSSAQLAPAPMSWHGMAPAPTAPSYAPLGAASQVPPPPQTSQHAFSSAPHAYGTYLAAGSQNLASEAPMASAPMLASHAPLGPPRQGTSVAPATMPAAAHGGSLVSGASMYMGHSPFESFPGLHPPTSSAHAAAMVASTAPQAAAANPFASAYPTYAQAAA